ncbi:MAG: nucleotidyltransferase family protein [Fidelibacterota bacterium]
MKKSCLSKVENQLLVSLACYPVDSDRPPNIDDKSFNVVDWEKIIKRAAAEGVELILYKNLKTFFPQYSLPSNIENTLRRSYYCARIEIDTYVEKLVPLFQLLNSEDIKYLVLRGININATLYRDSWLRSFSDVDLLVEPEKRAVFIEYLMHSGFTGDEIYDNVFYRDGLTLDLHFHPVDSDRIISRNYLSDLSFEDLFRRRVRIKFANLSFWGLWKIDQISLLAFHLLKHSYSQLIWIADISNAMYGLEGAQEWEDLYSRAYEKNLLKPIYYVCYFLNEALGLTFNGMMVRYFNSKELNLLEKLLLNRFIIRRRADQTAELFMLFMISGALKKLKFLKESLFLREGIRHQVSEYQTFKDKILYFPERVIMLLKILFKLIFRSFNRKPIENEEVIIIE